MTAGNAVSVTNGVTGVTALPLRFRSDWKSTCFGFPPVLTGHSAGAAFLAAISSSRLSI